MGFLGLFDLAAITIVVLYLSARKGVWTGTARPIFWIVALVITLEGGLLAWVPTLIDVIVNII